MRVKLAAVRLDQPLVCGLVLPARPLE